MGFQHLTVPQIVSIPSIQHYSFLNGIQKFGQIWKYGNKVSDYQFVSLVSFIKLAESTTRFWVTVGTNTLQHTQSNIRKSSD